MWPSLLFRRIGLDGKDKEYPFVEILPDGDEWTVVEGKPETDLIKKKISIPLGSSDMDHTIRMRELGHAKWTPSKVDRLPHGVKKDALESIEAARISEKLRRAGIDVSSGIMPKSTADISVSFRLATNDERQLALSLIAYHGSDYYGAIIKKLDEVVLEGNKAVSKHLRDPSKTTSEDIDKSEMGITANRASYAANVILNCIKTTPNESLAWQTTTELATWLERYLSSERPKPISPKVTKAAGKDTGGGEMGDGDELTDKYGKITDEAIEEALKPLIDSLPAYSRAKGKWGSMVLEKPPIVEAVRERHVKRERHSSEEGVFLKEVWRLFTDRQVFQTTRKRKGGSVLIDASGSMSLTSRDIQEIVDAAPAVVVAAYSGNGGKGVCRELVRNGHKIENCLICPPNGGGNIIDGPALKDWLALKPEPRIWISDGYVTGISDNSYSNLLEESIDICNKHSILRVGSVAEAKKVFREIERKGGCKSHPAMKLRKARGE